MSIILGGINPFGVLASVGAEALAGAVFMILSGMVDGDGMLVGVPDGAGTVVGAGTAFTEADMDMDGTAVFGALLTIEHIITAIIGLMPTMLVIPEGIEQDMSLIQEQEEPAMEDII